MHLRASEGSETVGERVTVTTFVSLVYKRIKFTNSGIQLGGL